MNIFGLRYFNFAGSNDHVTFSRKGIEIANGKGLAGLLRPSTTVSVVPLGVKTVTFQVVERSKDKQSIVVVGELVVENIPEMRETFDFSVYPQNGQFRNDPTSQIEDQVRIAVRRPIRSIISTLTVDEIVKEGAKKLEEMLFAAIDDAGSELMKKLKANHIAVQSGSIKSAAPADRELSGAIGADEREAVLRAQDDAVANRRMGAAEKDREIRTYEEETALTLETDRSKRIAKEGENRVAMATSEAQAIEKRLEPFANMEPGAVLAHAVMQAAEQGINRISLDPALLAAVRGAA